MKPGNEITTPAQPAAAESNPSTVVTPEPRSAADPDTASGLNAPVPGNMAEASATPKQSQQAEPVAGEAGTPKEEAQDTQPAKVAAEAVKTVNDNDDDDEIETDADEDESGEDFAAMLAESETKAVRFVSQGEKLTGTVVLKTADMAYVNIGMRSEAQLELNPEEPRHIALAEGDRIEVFVTQPTNPVRLSLDPIMGFGDLSVVEDAFEQGTPIEGKVQRAVKGGYEINFDGVRAFCPISQLDLYSVEDPQTLIGTALSFKVIEFEGGSKSNVVVSRRTLLEEERNRKMAETRKTLAVGAVLEGDVVDIKPFGAFVDLGGLTGLVHISELSHQRVDRVEDALAIGDRVKAKVLDIKPGTRGERISLSMKALLPDPWDELSFKAGDSIEGVVVRNSRFGIFINVQIGVDGLLPMRFLKSGGRNLDLDSFEQGQTLTVEVVDLDTNERKVTLALPGWNEQPVSALQIGAELSAEVVKVIPAGILVQAVEDMARGLVPKRYLKEGSQRQISDHYRIGSTHRVVLNEIDERGRFTFKLKTEETVDQQTLSNFLEEDPSFGHNPFSEFFNKKP